MYRRRDSGIKINKKGTELDNRHVVPYCMKLLKKFQAHINVEWCNKSEVLKYLFKYVTKGTDRSNVVFTKYKKRKHGAADDANDVPESSSATKRTKVELRGKLGAKKYEIDEIANFLKARYLSDKESLWRMYGYDIHHHYPAVERLACHLPNMNNVIFKSTTNLPSLVSTPFL